jgi:hypothetical protein
VPCDSYRGVICLIGASQMSQNHQNEADDRGASFHKALILLGASLWRVSLCVQLDLTIARNGDPA